MKEYIVKVVITEEHKNILEEHRGMKLEDIIQDMVEELIREEIGQE